MIGLGFEIVSSSGFVIDFEGMGWHGWRMLVLLMHLKHVLDLGRVIVTPLAQHSSSKLQMAAMNCLGVQIELLARVTDYADRDCCCGFRDEQQHCPGTVTVTPSPQPSPQETSSRPQLGAMNRPVLVIVMDLLPLHQPLTHVTRDVRQHQDTRCGLSLSEEEIAEGCELEGAGWGSGWG